MMNKVVKALKYLGLSIVILVIILAIILRTRYGGGEQYPDISTPPVYEQEDLELVTVHHEPIGNVAASKDPAQATRVFFTIHPESRPEQIKLMESEFGKGIPYPNLEAQSLFTTPLGLFTDLQNRLWVIDHGNHGFDEVQLFAFDLHSNKLVHKYSFPTEVAKKLSFFNDLSVSPNGRYVVVANVSFFGKKPSLAVYDIQTGRSLNRLENHSSMRHEGYVPTTPAKKMRFFGGLVDLLTGVDGLDFSRDGEYLYYAPMGHSKLFRIPSADLLDFDQSENELEKAVEVFAEKPLSDGIRTDHQGNIYITDIEHQGIYLVTPNRTGFTLIKDQRIRWADGLSLGADGYFYLADSDIPNQMLQSKRHMAEHAPYYLLRFKPYWK